LPLPCYTSLYTSFDLPQFSFWLGLSGPASLLNSSSTHVFVYHEGNLAPADASELTPCSIALLQKLSVSQLDSSHFMGPEGSSPSSQERATCPQYELDQPTPRHNIIDPF